MKKREEKATRKTRRKLLICLRKVKCKPAKSRSAR